MNQTNTKEFSLLMKKMAICFRTQLSPEEVGVYFGELQDLPIESVRKGVENIIREANFFPKVSEFRLACPYKTVKKEELPYIPTKEEKQEFSQFLGGVKEILKAGGKL